jgi:hypothetical protein
MVEPGQQAGLVQEQRANSRIVAELGKRAFDCQMLNEASDPDLFDQEHLGHAPSAKVAHYLQSANRGREISAATCRPSHSGIVPTRLPW